MDHGVGLSRERPTPWLSTPGGRHTSPHLPPQATVELGTHGNRTNRRANTGARHKRIWPLCEASSAGEMRLSHTKSLLLPEAWCALNLEHATLSRNTPRRGEPVQSTVGREYAMAGHDDRKWIAAITPTARAASGAPTDLAISP